MATKKICIITQSHLCRNPRVVKEALALAEEGYEVTIINGTYSKALTLEDKELISHHNIKLISIASLENKSFSSFYYKLFKRIGDNLIKYTRIETSMALGYASWMYKKVALRQNAGLYICHQELGLYCGVQLLKAGKTTAFDFEDWYSEDLLEEARIQRPIKLLKQCEAIALQKGAFCITTSNIMATELAKTYNSRVPQTIYNTFVADKDILSVPKRFEQPLKLFWFSQTIGPGRGIEDFLQLISKVKTKFEVHLLGQISNDYKYKLTAIQHCHHLFFHDLIPSKELAQKIARFDIGLALEVDQPASRNYTITNKLFQYMLSGLPVIATNTAGQQEIIDQYGGGLLIDLNYPEKAINALEQLLNDQSQLQYLGQQAVGAALALCWKNEKVKLLTKVQQAV